jgi:hypothetical protein
MDHARNDRHGQGARSAIVVAAAMAMLAGAVVVLLSVGSDPEREGASAESKPATPLVGAEGSAFAYGRGATDPDAAAASASTKAGAGSGLDATGLPDVDPCALLGASSLDSTLGPSWTASPSSAIGSAQCRWSVDGQPHAGKPAKELTVTASDAALYDRLRRLSDGSLKGLGDAAIVSNRAPGHWVAVRVDDTTVFVAFSSAAASAEKDAVALAREATAAFLSQARRG